MGKKITKEITKEQLASDFSQVVKEPVLSMADSLYSLYNNEYEFLKIEYPFHEDYLMQQKLFYEAKVAQLKKILPFKIGIDEFLQDVFMNALLKGIGESGGTLLEHDQVRKLVALAAKNKRIKYSYGYVSGINNFGKISVKALVGGEEIIFKFALLADKFKQAAQFVAIEKLLNHIRSEKNTNPRAEQNKPRSDSDCRLMWMGRREELENIFIRMSEHRHEVYGLVIDTISKVDRGLFIKKYFIVDKKHSDKITIPVKPLRYNGDISVLVRFFYYLTHNHPPGLNEPYIKTSKEKLVHFLSDGFEVMDKEGNWQHITESTIVRALNTFSKITNKAEVEKKQPANALFLFEKEHRDKNRGLINFLRTELDTTKVVD